ncbi:ABC transporter substrate-binding protein [Cohnella lubricantis]|uniref:SgrR family transcriptional regulator n=1 Tax=Cohnella lubricantis TaxID=2163172 RepID=A0A841TD03_9BACL|nr:ABC transporter substrate-binding protein [Cohnella lubricantis]MBB6678066.1 SgrR family transcriptional regulator [Cohnella lubricantis]MBP2120044.1 MarR-like DNA-binding transcriptional regulator SgrR of sgrS sRNA [Cohnella lubricantis]
MRDLEHFLRLYSRLGEAGVGEPFPVSREQLVDILGCTLRHVPLILRKLSERRWIDWVPGRGRGHLSSLTFRISRDQLIGLEATELLAQGRVAEAIQWMRDEVRDESVSARFLQLLQKHFGLVTDRTKPIAADTLRVPFYRPLLHLDPASVYRRSEAHLVRQTMETLLRFDPIAQRPLPHLAHHWEMKLDGAAWIFYLRRDVPFHHGRVMTAADVKYTLDRLTNPKTGSGYRSLFLELQEVIVLSDTAVQFELRRPNALFPRYLCLACASILPLDQADEPNFSRLPIGTGPWKISRNDESLVVLEAHRAYYFGRPHLDRVEILIIPEADQENALGIIPDEEVYYYPFQKTPHNPDWNQVTQTESGVVFLAMNLWREGPLVDPRLRQAIDLALDRQQMIRDLGAPDREEAFGFVRREQESRIRKTSLAQAAALVAESGYSGEELRLFSYASSDFNERNTSWIRLQLSSIGIRIENHSLPLSELSCPERQREADMIFAGYVYDEDVELSLIENLESGYIRSLLEPAIAQFVDERLRAAKQQPDQERRHQIYQEIEDRLRAERSLLFLYHEGQSTVFHPSLQGANVNVRGWVDFKDIWIRR